ncbi:MAG: L-threonylcarbamoyladenylate synthase [Acidobacteriota bacterium]
MLRVPLETLRLAPEGLAFLRQLLSDGGVVAIPTDTFYGLAVDPRSARGVERIVRLKGRAEVKGLPVLFATREQLAGLGVDENPASVDRYMALWPAPLSVIFRLRDPIAASGGRSTLAVRLPAAPAIHFLLEAAGPLTATSANRSGEPPLDDADEVEALFGDRLDLLVDGGRTPGGKPSTLVDATSDPPVLLRDGAYPWPPDPGTGGR